MFAVIGLGMIFDAVGLAVGGLILPVMMNIKWVVSLTDTALLISGPLFAAAIGAGVAGWLGDIFGRKRSFQWNLLGYSVPTVLSVLSPLSISWWCCGQ
jgi:putative MFS transporter